MYKAKFVWNQNTKFPIYRDIIKPLIESQDSDRFSLSKTESDGDNNSKLKEITLYLDILEDFSYDIKSNFQGYADAISSISGIAGSILSFFEKMNQLSAIGGKSSAMQEYMKFQVWKDTEPFRMSFKFVLETKNDPFIDVYAPAMALCSMAILSPVSDNNSVVFYTPGVNSGGMKALDRKPETTTPAAAPTGRAGATATTNSARTNSTASMSSAWEKNSKLFSTFSIVASRVDGDTALLHNEGASSDSEIPIVIIRDAFLESAKPTWSKERTSSGIPLRCELELTIQSVFSANDAMFAYLGKNKSTRQQSLTSAGAVVATNIFR